MTNPPSSGLGSRFVSAFVRQLGGTLATTSENGTTSTMRLPASILAEMPEATE
jgi:two-component sensor histidine kinase